MSYRKIRIYLTCNTFILNNYKIYSKIKFASLNSIRFPTGRIKLRGEQDPVDGNSKSGKPDGVSLSRTHQRGSSDNVQK